MEICSTLCTLTTVCPLIDRLLLQQQSMAWMLTAAMSKDNLFATQFHPEKSGNKGLKILENFVRSTRC